MVVLTLQSGRNESSRVHISVIPSHPISFPPLPSTPPSTLHPHFLPSPPLPLSSRNSLPLGSLILRTVGVRIATTAAAAAFPGTTAAPGGGGVGSRADLEDGCQRRCTERRQRRPGRVRGRRRVAARGETGCRQARRPRRVAAERCCRRRSGTDGGGRRGRGFERGMHGCWVVVVCCEGEVK